LLWFRDDVDDGSMHLALNEEVAPASVDKEARPPSDSSRPDALMRREEGTDRLAMDVVDKPRPAAIPAPTTLPAQPALSVQSEPPREISKSAVGTDFFKADRQAMYLGTAAVEGERRNLEATESDASLAMVMELNPMDELAPLVRATSSGRAALQTAVLQNFTVVNDGRRVRLIDADGSTYEGVLHPVNGATAGVAARTPAMLDRSTDTSAAFAASAPANGAGLLNYKVVASGTNRSLKQAIQFEGDLALTEQQVELGRNFFSNTVPAVALKNKAKVSAEEAQLIPGRLQGNAVLEDGLNVKVDALLLAR
jgi:hypothetical protein